MDNNKKPPFPLVPVPEAKEVDDVVEALGLVPEEFNFRFILDGKEVAKFWWDKEDKRLKFDGDLDESAKILFQLVQMYFLEWECQRGNG